MKRTSFNKITAGILSLAFAMAFLPTLSANAATVDDNSVKANTTTSAQIICNDSLYDTNKELCDRIAEGLNNLEDEIYVGDLTVDVTQLGYIMKTVIRTHPELFFVNSKQFAIASNDTGVELVVPFYKGEKSEIEVQRKKFDTRVNEIMSLVTDDMTDFEKALIFHDEIALNCNYLDDDKTGIRNVSAYDALVTGRANCQGYTEAYSYLLLLSNITTEIVESSAMVHVWNNVCLDGEFYNVDVTWDDPVPNKEGHVNHNFFLLSDKEIISKGNYGFAYECCACVSTKYDNALFHEIDTRFCRIGKDFYAIDNKADSQYKNCLIKINPQTNAVTVLENFNYRWLAGEKSYWKNAYMSLEAHNDMLYFNSPDGIYSYDVNTKTMTALNNSADTTVGNNLYNSYYGLVIKGDDIYVAASDTPNQEFTLTLAGVCAAAPIGVGITRTMTLGNNVRTSILFGDIDSDGRVKITDATLIQKYAVEMETFNEAQFTSADVNGDGKVNVLDCTSIQKYIVGL